MKRLTAILIAILTLLTLAACGAPAPAATAGAETKVITDCAGREVSIPKDPQRVACLYASTAHIIAVVGEGGKIVGVPDGVRRDVLMRKLVPGIENAAVPYQEGAINAEELVRIKADLALLRASTAANDAETAKLDKLGIPYVVVDYDSIDGVRTAVRVVGEVFGKEAAAQKYIDFFDGTLAYVAERMEGVSEQEKPRVYHAVNESTRTDIAGDICSEITALAGLINVSTAGGTESTGDKSYATLEQIYAWSPDAIIANDANATAYMLSDSKWAGLNAVAGGRVYTLPVGLTRWCHPGSIEPHMAVLFIARQFYPQRFEELNIVETTRDYYNTFFGLDITDEVAVQVLSGVGMRDAKTTAKAE